MVRCIFLLTFLLLQFSIWAQSEEYYLHLEARPGVPAIPETAAQPEASEIVAGHYYRIVQFTAIPGPDEKEALKAKGIQLLEYIPNNAYYVAIPAHLDDPGSLFPHQRAIIPLDKGWKTDPEIQEQPLPPHTQREAGIALHVAFYSNLSAEQIESTIRANDWQMERLDRQLNIATVVIPKGQIAQLADHPAVRYIELVSPPGEPENYESAALNRSAMLNGTSFSNYDFDGSGIKVQLQDDGTIGPHIDYKNRVQEQFTMGNFGDHGDHTAGTIFGAGNLDPLGKGMAPGAELYVYDYDEFNDSINTHYDRYNIRITSTSYSNGCNDGYTATAQTHDNQVKQFPDLLHVFSAGNSNGSDCDYGAGSEWGNVTGGHKVGKNVMAVANTDKLGVISNSSSRGPAHDGRIKPDIAAVGSGVYSTIDPNDYDQKSGTSMSCPAVAGSGALLYEAYESSHNGQTPPSALIKSAMLNTTNDLGNEGPDFIYGWGMLNTHAATEVIVNKQYRTDTIDQGEMQEFTINVPTNSAEARIMLYWHDQPAATGVSKALVNDLDLKVVAPNGDTLLPRVLNSFPDPDSLDMTAQPGEDHHNNVEQVFVKLPTAGAYQVLVEGYQIPEGPQSYFVTTYLPEQGIEVTFPNGGEGLVAEQLTGISWDNFTNTQSDIDISISADSGNTWQTIVSNLASTDLVFPWQPTAGTSGSFLVKVESDNYEDISDTFFTITGRPTNITFDYACCNEFQVSWNDVAEADSYRVYVSDSLYMQPEGTTTSTNFTIEDFSQNKDVWVSVSAMINGGEGLRSLAQLKPQGPFNCNLAHNLTLTKVSSPSQGIVSSCIYEDSLPVKATVQNFSDSAIYQPELTYVGGGQMETFQYIDSIRPGEEVEVTFPQKLPIPPTGQHSMQVYLSHPLDVNRCDDTLTISYTLAQSDVVTVPYSDDLESNLPCSELMSCGEVECDLRRGLMNAQNGVIDDIDWRTDLGGTFTINSGPSADHNPGKAYGKYLYLEASGGCTEQEAILQLPCFDLSGLIHPTFEFWYHMYGSTMGTLKVEVNDGSGWQRIFRLSGNRGNQWRKRSINLTEYAGQTISLRIVGITGDGPYSDMAIDDFRLYDDVPVIAEFSGSDTICIGEKATYQASINTKVLDANWNFGSEASPSTATGLAPVEVAFSDSGVQEIELAVFRERDTTHFTYDIWVANPPEARFEYFPQGAQTIQFVNTSDGADTYRWQLGNNDSSSAIEPLHQYGDTTQRQVTLIASNAACSDSITKSVDLAPFPGDDQVLLLYPNPANEKINVQLVRPTTRQIEMQVINVNGQVMWDREVSDIELNTFEINLTNLSAGVYFIKAIIGDIYYLERFVVTND